MFINHFEFVRWKDWSLNYFNLHCNSPWNHFVLSFQQLEACLLVHFWVTKFEIYFPGRIVLLIKEHTSNTLTCLWVSWKLHRQLSELLSDFHTMALSFLSHTWFSGFYFCLFFLFCGGLKLISFKQRFKITSAAHYPFLLFPITKIEIWLSALFGDLYSP